RETFETYGVDSLMALEVTKGLESSFGELPKTLLFEYQTLEDLATYFAAHHAATLRVLLPAAGSPSAVTAPEPSSPLAASVSVPFPRANEAGALDIAVIGLAGRYPRAAT